MREILDRRQLTLPCQLLILVACAHLHQLFDRQHLAGCLSLESSFYQEDESFRKNPPHYDHLGLPRLMGLPRSHSPSSSGQRRRREIGEDARCIR